MTAQPLQQPAQPQTPSPFDPLPPEKIKRIIEELDSWCNVGEEDAQEQRETLEYLIKALDEDRLSYRKLFP
ncbi:hypothetical protein NG798_06965 [Ancylothrix sp. C2]|uniref:hypothetical protein n=1 Tax=Ancylothrix sp. D3o TaxID=2953691 RepID=UPI0021BAA5C3|nr:hypothetical protein [Ancylothrix sp. D3o]MCT7949521.1 hypothetical protein [Ancylothrix sp. D3o]